MNIQHISNKPLYEQVILGIKEDIMTGVLVEGDKLPSVRQMAKQLTINPNTISKAYKELEQQQVIITVRGKGTFVSGETNQASDTRAIEELQAKFDEIIIEASTLKLTQDDLIDWVRKSSLKQVKEIQDGN